MLLAVARSTETLFSSQCTGQCIPGRVNWQNSAKIAFAHGSTRSSFQPCVCCQTVCVGSTRDDAIVSLVSEVMCECLCVYVTYQLVACTGPAGLIVYDHLCRKAVAVRVGGGDRARPIRFCSSTVRSLSVSETYSGWGECKGVKAMKKLDTVLGRPGTASCPAIITPRSGRNERVETSLVMLEIVVSCVCLIFSVSPIHDKNGAE